MSRKTPNQIDIHVGSRVRARRMMLDMSQEKLAEAVGITFQQIQKYEKGTNRIGASRLSQIAQALKVSPGFFFEGSSGDEVESNPVLDEATKSRGALRLLQTFNSLDAQGQQSLLSIADTIESLRAPEIHQQAA